MEVPSFVHFALSANPEILFTKTFDWMIDSGCTNHMYFNKEEFTQYQSYRAGILLANGSSVWTEGRGTVEMEWLLPEESALSPRLAWIPTYEEATQGQLGVAHVAPSLKTTMLRRNTGSFF